MSLNKVTVFPDGTVLSEWLGNVPPTPTPHDNFKLGVTGDSDATYAKTGSISKTLKTTIPVGSTNIDYVVRYRHKFRYLGSPIVFTPGVRFRFYVGGIQRGSDVSLSLDSAGVFTNGQLEWIFVPAIPGSDWITGPREIERFTINGFGQGTPNIYEAEADEGYY